MRALALDIGKKRTGIAVSDAGGRIASPVKVMQSSDVLGNSREWKRLLQDYEPDLLVVGLPVSMDGVQNDHAAWIKQVAADIARLSSLPVEFQDERLSSSEAKRIMHEQGLSERDMRGKLDMVAASVFLQTFLDKHE